MTNRGDEFLAVYNKFYDWLKSRYFDTITYGDALYEAVKTDQLIRQHSTFLKKMGHLRNAIVHEDRLLQQVIAEPRPDIIEQFSKICDLIYNPPKAIDMCDGRRPEILSCNAFLREALFRMRENDYSQIIIENKDDSYGLLTRDTVAKWFEANIKQDIVSIKETRLSDIVRHQNPDAACFIGRSASFFDVREMFASPKNIVQAVIITHSGKETEKPLGILTPADMMKEGV